jgi:hypothetical protein
MVGPVLQRCHCVNLARETIAEPRLGDLDSDLPSHPRVARAILFLMNDAGTNWLGPISPGTNFTLQNSQCVLRAADSSVTGSGPNLTVKFGITFLPSFAGTKNIYLDAQGSAGYSGWMQTC